MLGLGLGVSTVSARVRVGGQGARLVHEVDSVQVGVSPVARDHVGWVDARRAVGRAAVLAAPLLLDVEVGLRHVGLQS